ncbi:hypothetical protein BDM02DRAFT_1869674 [Thelephora ganbajun]|uniref:Uncharacterized protein n=1 Tax=Thelephora ganbajun TaxID=370292 RepID=A0ACB6ZIJ8_THEGA|nr:hypothetical protein BDM02DRAFT_1869674 [Thelephora ganbajun]
MKVLQARSSLSTPPWFYCSPTFRVSFAFGILLQIGVMSISQFLLAGSDGTPIVQCFKFQRPRPGPLYNMQVFSFFDLQPPSACMIEEWKNVLAPQRRRRLRYRNRHAPEILIYTTSYYPTTIVSSDSTERCLPVPRLFIALRAHSGTLVTYSDITGERAYRAHRDYDMQISRERSHDFSTYSRINLLQRN